MQGKAVCVICDNVTERRCSECNKVAYCSVECEEKDKEHHRERSCRKSPDSIEHRVYAFLSETKVFNELAKWYVLLPTTVDSHPYFTIYLHGSVWGGEGPTKIIVETTSCKRARLVEMMTHQFPNYPIKTDIELIPFFRVARVINGKPQLVFFNFIRIPESFLQRVRSSIKMPTENPFFEGDMQLRFHNGHFVDAREVHDFVVVQSDLKN